MRFNRNLANLTLRSSGTAEMGYEIIDSNNSKRNKSLYDAKIYTRGGMHSTGNPIQISFQIVFNHTPEPIIKNIIQEKMTKTLFEEINSGIPCPVSGRVMNDGLEIDQDAIRYAENIIPPELILGEGVNCNYSYAPENSTKKSVKAR